MKNVLFLCLAGSLFLILGWTITSADNFFITTHPTSDPAPSVFTHKGETRVYVYTTQDKIITPEKPYPIDTIRCYSSDDMFHWRDEGVVLDEKRMPNWIFKDGHSLWAPHVVYIKGLYRLFASEATTSEGDKSAYCFTATASEPAGPFQVTPSYISETGVGAIDPFCFIDSAADSVRVYLVYRNSEFKSCIARMNDSGTTIIGNPWTLSGLNDSYTEGGWLFKNNDYYYLLYATKPLTTNEIIAYATAPVSPSGGITPKTVWTPQGKIIGPTTDWTNHTGVCSFKAKGENKPRWYIFWHGASDLGPKLFSPGQSRCSAIEYMHFTNNTTPLIAPVLQTHRGVGICNAASDTIQIDRYSSASGCSLRSLPFSGTHVDVPGWYLGVSDSAKIFYNDVYFPSSQNTVFTSVVAHIASTVSNGKLEVHVDSVTGTLLGTIEVPATGGATIWQTTTPSPLDVLPPSGVHNIVIVAPTGKFYLNWIKFVTAPVENSTRSPLAHQPPFSVTRLTRNIFIFNNCEYPFQIKLINIRGQEILDGFTVSKTNNIVNVNIRKNALSSGFYILVVNSGKDVFEKPFVY